MKKIVALILMVVMTVVTMTACSGGNGVDAELSNIGTTQALVGKFTNNSDADVKATITVTWYNENDEQIGYSVSELPYIMQGDSAFDVFDFNEYYDHYDYIIETGEPTDAAKDFYSNLTVESEQNEDGSINYTVGGGNGEAFEADVVVQFINQDDKVIDYTIVTAKGEGTATGTIEGSKEADCSGYIMTVNTKGMM